MYLIYEFEFGSASERSATMSFRCDRVLSFIFALNTDKGERTEKKNIFTWVILSKNFWSEYIVVNSKSYLELLKIDRYWILLPCFNTLFK